MMSQFLQETIKEAGGFAKSIFEKGVQNIQTKSHENDFLTEADLGVSELFVKKVKEAYPGHAILSEELDEIVNEGAEYEWVIDPIDGTRNFAVGIPSWCISIALAKDGETILGALYNPLSDQLFFAEKGKGSFLNGKKLQVNNTQHLESSLGIMVRANGSGIYGDYFERFRAVYTKLILESDAWLVNYGTVFNKAFVATGGMDFAVGNAGMTWDFLALFLICEEAGAVVTDSDGNPWKRGRQDYVIANPELHPKLLDLFTHTHGAAV